MLKIKANQYKTLLKNALVLYNKGKSPIQENKIGTMQHVKKNDDVEISMQGKDRFIKIFTELNNYLKSTDSKLILTTKMRYTITFVMFHNKFTAYSLYPPSYYSAKNLYTDPPFYYNTKSTEKEISKNSLTALYNKYINELNSISEIMIKNSKLKNNVTFTDCTLDFVLNAMIHFLDTIGAKELMKAI